MENVATMYKQIEKAMAYFMEEENYTELQALFYMVEDFARTITKSKKHKAMFYTALMQIIDDKGINKADCTNLIHSYKNAVKNINK